jgi:hypothetical protein
MSLGTRASLHFGRDKQPYLLAPIIHRRRRNSYRKLIAGGARTGAVPRDNIASICQDGYGRSAEQRWDKPIPYGRHLKEEA